MRKRLLPISHVFASWIGSACRFQLRSVMDRLPAVLQQLVMQCLDAPCLPRLMRCSHSLHRVASSPIAWRYATVLLTPMAEAPHFATRWSRPPFANAPVRLRLMRQDIPGSADTWTALLALPLRLVELDLSRCDLAKAELIPVWLQLLQHPALKSVHTVSFPTNVFWNASATLVSKVMHAVLQLPALTSLANLKVEVLHPNASGVNVNWNGCVKLRKLQARYSVDRNRLVWVDSIRQCFSHPSLHNLQSLDMRHWNIPRHEDFYLALHPLQHLQHLELGAVEPINLLLPGIVRALPALDSVALEPANTWRSQPTPLMLQSVLHSAPGLCIVVRLVLQDSDYPFTRYRLEECAEEIHSAMRHAGEGDALRTRLRVDDRRGS